MSLDFLLHRSNRPYMDSKWSKLDPEIGLWLSQIFPFYQVHKAVFTYLYCIYYHLLLRAFHYDIPFLVPNGPYVGHFGSEMGQNGPGFSKIFSWMGIKCWASIIKLLNQLWSMINYPFWLLAHYRLVPIRQFLSIAV